MIRDHPRMVSSLVMALLTTTDALVALLVAQIVAMNPKNSKRIPDPDPT